MVHELGGAKRNALRTVFARFGITDVDRAIQVDATEEISLVPLDQLARVDQHELYHALLEVRGSVKLWVIPQDDIWDTEPL